MWSLYNNSEFLEPLKFTNGKTQEDVVKEVLELIKKGAKIIFIKGMCGTGKCLDKDSLVFCKPNGDEYFSYHPIVELVGKVGRIVSKDNSGNIIESSFNNVRKTGKKKLYKLKTRTGREVLLSKNHPLLTITEKGIEWKPLEELDEKSYICLPNKIDVKSDGDYDDDKIKILAHLIAEGKLGDRTGSPKYYQCPRQNPIIREDYIGALKKVFPEGEIKERDKEVVINFGLMDTTKGTTNKLRLFVREHGLDGKRSSEKFVPKIIFGLKKEKIAIFLSRLFSCDGSIYSRKKETTIEYSSISKRLVQDVSILLQMFGIQYTISSKEFRGNKNYLWRICISNQENLRRYIEDIGFIGRKQNHALNILKDLKEHKFTNIDKVPRIIRYFLKNQGYSFAELDRLVSKEDKNLCVFKQGKIDFLRSHLERTNELIKNEKISEICNPNIYWDKIKSVEFVKEDETYDLEAPEFHNFISDGIIVHNSAIALNIAKDLGKTSVIVPGKNLQNQYKKDYENGKYILKDNKERLKISVITGRNNHECLFIKDREIPIPIIKREINSSLNNIFEFSRQEMEEKRKRDKSADNLDIPCKIEIKERNFRRIIEYLKKNKNINLSNIQSASDVKRLPLASVCPYWSPVLPEVYDLKNLDYENKRTYMGLENTKFVIYQRKPGCKFYEQFNSYIDSDVIVFNSLKYKLESALNRKPLTEAEIIDECDEFLDSFTNERHINLERLQNSLIQFSGTSTGSGEIIEEISKIISYLKVNKWVIDSAKEGNVIPLKKTGIYDLLRIFLDQKEFSGEIDEESYLFEVEETARMFEDFMDDAYVIFSKKENNLIVNIVTTNLSKKFKEMLDKNKIIILMSGTLHSERILDEIFGLKDFKTIEAETEQPGRIDVLKTGLEFDCRYDNLNGKRGSYLKALDKCVEISKKPTLVHVSAFSDLPSEFEIQDLNLKNLQSRESLKEMQDEDKNGIMIERFKDGSINVLFTTKCARGVDFPGKQCNSIVFTKYPNPNPSEPFWKILRQTNPNQYWDFYKDKAKRELLQKIYRGLRFREDHIYLLSPDIRILNEFER